MLGHALDHHAWNDADSIVRALDAYWDTRGLSQEATAWADRILTATTGPGEDTPTAEDAAASLWLYTMIREATRRMIAGQPEQAARTYQQALAYLRDQPETEWTRRGIAVLYHQLGMTAQDRGRLDEADNWYRQALTIKEELGDRPSMAITYHELGITAQGRGRLEEAEDWYRRAIQIREELGLRALLATDYHQLGTTAQARGRLDEADNWYRKSLTIKEDLGNPPGMALTYGQLGLLAEERGQRGQALAWTVRCVALFDQFPHPVTGPGPEHLARLTHQLGMPALEQTWQQVTGQPLPQPVRDYLTSAHDDNSGGRP